MKYLRATSRQFKGYRPSRHAVQTGTITWMKCTGSWIALLFLAAATSCTDRAGNRIAMDDWFHGRSTDNVPKRSRAAEPAATPSQAASLAPASLHDLPADATPAQQKKADRALAAEFANAAPAPPPGAVLPDVLVVDDERISVTDILEPIEQRLEELARSLPASNYFDEAAKLVRAQIVEHVAQHLIWRRAKTHLSEEMEPQVDKAVGKMEKDRINREFGGRETLYEKYLAKHGKSRDDVKKRLRKIVLIDSYLRDRLLPQINSPRKQELMAYFNQHRADFSRPERREMFLIDIPVNAFLDTRRWPTRQEQQEAETRARNEIEAAQAALQRGESFEDVARKHSRGLHTESGGNWGLITKPAGNESALQGHWEVPSRRLFELQPGETSEIIHAANSFFIVRVGQIEPAEEMTFQQAQPKIVDTIRQERFIRLRTEFLQAELEKATIGSLEDFVTRVMRGIPKPAR